jgi:hypothetical protein
MKKRKHPKNLKKPTQKKLHKTNKKNKNKKKQKRKRKKEKKKYTLPCRHDRVCLKIFLKQDKLKWSNTETGFNEIFQDCEKVEKSRSSIV